MKVRGTSDYTIETDLDRDEVLAVMQRALDGIKAEHAEVVDAYAIAGPEPHELRIQIVLRSDSYGAAEGLMDLIAPLVMSTVPSTYPATSPVRRGSTELVPA